MTGITMVLNQAAVACDHCDGGILATLAPASPVITGWTPGFDTPVRWRVEDNADGSSRVEIAVNPFQFNPTTGDAVYFREFTLEMDVITTGVMLEELSVQPQTLRTGDILTANLRLSNYDSPQDVVVQASVRLRGNNAFVTGLPLQTLHQLSGQASTQLAWDSNGLAQGDYQLMVELLDGEGNQLASQVDEFGVGILDGQVTGLSASASEVKPGEPISFTLAFANAGTVPYTGTATIQVQPVGNISDSVTFHVASPLLTASETWTTTIVWDASVSAAQFRVIGLVRYRSQSTEPSELWLTGGYQLYLPAIVRP
jgi:uncharacterized repeat protein (TIGR01451 family)